MRTVQQSPEVLCLATDTVNGLREAEGPEQHKLPQSSKLRVGRPAFLPNAVCTSQPAHWPLQHFRAGYAPRDSPRYLAHDTSERCHHISLPATRDAAELALQTAQ